jgi:serine/threonine-protein kinase
MATAEMFGRYIVFEQLGIGGMASVHVAEARGAGGFRKRVALKRLLPHAASDPMLVDLFVQEARLDARLHHPNITRTFDFGQVDDTYFIAMELVAGPTLSQLLKHCHATIGQVPVPVALHVLVEVCEALDYAHTLADENGKPLQIVHRDVSPPNIIISRTGAVKLIDFGVARAETTTKTQAGMIKGKLAYLPPEYISVGKLDARADLWSLGVVAHELLTCERLFDAANELQMMELIRARDIPPPSRTNTNVSRSLDAIVMTALERDPERRWQSAAAVRTALRGEIAERGCAISNRQVMAWVEWAFSQTTREERSGVSELIALLDQPKEPTIIIDPDPDTSPGRPAATIKRRVKQPKLPTAPSRIRGGWRVRWWLVVLLLLAGGALFAVQHWGAAKVWHAISAPIRSKH